MGETPLKGLFAAVEYRCRNKMAGLPIKFSPFFAVLMILATSSTEIFLSRMAGRRNRFAIVNSFLSKCQGLLFSTDPLVS